MAVISRTQFISLSAAAALHYPFFPLLSKKKQAMTATILSTGEILPRIGLGTYQIFEAVEPQHAAALLGEFYSLGGRLVDSSPMYGEAEAVTGSASVQLGLNAQLFLATKVWTSGRERGVSQIKESLRLLGRQKLELMQIHNLVDWKTQIKTLRTYKEAGIFRYIGLTHYQVSVFRELARILKNEAVDFLQIPYSIAETAAEERLLGIAHERQVAVIANEPFAQGRLFRQVKGKPVPAWAVERGMKSWAQYFLKFILSEPRIQFVIPATRRLEHLRDNMSAGVGYLPDASERQRMLADFRNL
ncbi:MAG TPA: aldo/keto reductase [Turneriella sp.]|nr:aldo/keto reductase [Turneriella sp.]